MAEEPATPADESPEAGLHQGQSAPGTLARAARHQATAAAADTATDAKSGLSRRRGPRSRHRAGRPVVRSQATLEGSEVRKFSIF